MENILKEKEIEGNIYQLLQVKRSLHLPSHIYLVTKNSTIISCQPTEGLALLKFREVIK